VPALHSHGCSRLLHLHVGHVYDVERVVEFNSQLQSLGEVMIAADAQWGSLRSLSQHCTALSSLSLNLYSYASSYATIAQVTTPGPAEELIHFHQLTRLQILSFFSSSTHHCARLILSNLQFLRFSHNVPLLPL